MLVRRNDFKEIEKLNTGSHKRVWFTCEKCDVGVLQSYKNYNNQNYGKFCRSCRNKHSMTLPDIRKKISNRMKSQWKSNEYRRLMSVSLSKGCKAAWDKDIESGGERRKMLSKNNPMSNENIKEILSKKTTTDISELVNICKEYGYEYIDRVRRIRGGVRIKFICDKGHLQEKRLDHFRSGSYRCAKCSMSDSDAENELYEYISCLDVDVILKNDRSLIKPYELDIVIPSKKIAIEYCGLYWHGENKGGKDRKYHLNKLQMCENIGYRLITIFEDEWINKNSIVKNRLRHIFGMSKEKTIYARKCYITDIDVKKARVVVDRRHIQGYMGSKIKLGAYYNGELVSVMTFSRPSVSKGKKGVIGEVWEIGRFCSMYNVIGIAGKFLSYFKKNYKWDEIFTFADRRWDTGNTYEKIGFKKIGYTSPNYWYFHTNAIKKWHRFNFRKNVLKDKLKYFDSNKTEWENMKYNGWDRIWDCGNILFSMKK